MTTWIHFEISSVFQRFFCEVLSTEKPLPSEGAEFPLASLRLRECHTVFNSGKHALNSVNPALQSFSALTLFHGG